MGLNLSGDFCLESETILQDETDIQQETVIKLEPFVNEEVETLIQQVTESDQIREVLFRKTFLSHL